MGVANQAVTPGRTTLLDAVNICLQNIGEQPVNTLESQQIVEAVVPANVVSWAPDPYEWAGRFQLRGQTVYDLEKHTSVLSSEISSIKADVVWLLPWDECPEAFNRWTTIRSARVFSDRVLSSDSIFKYTAMDEQAALVELQRVEIEQAQANSLTGGPGLRPFPTYSPGLGLLGRNRGYLRG